ncbi:MAG TPA: serine/threonine-protein kinase [Kofleriaceae bacterium]|jgi:hypothetical protein
MAVDDSERKTKVERPSGPGQERTAEAARPADEKRYTTGAEIARGGMGRVVEATDNMLGRVVAIKEVLTEDAESLKRFAREMRITARLEHPSIVPLYDAGPARDGEPPFYVMRRVSGRPLEEVIATAPTLDDRLALLPTVLAATQAIAHAHQRGVIHRDLKPSNILVGELGETVVIDWGLAKVMGETDDPAATIAPLPQDSLRTRIGTVAGTPGFMSPEQARGEELGPPTDVWALGACLYFLLARQPPHHSEGRTGDDLIDLAATLPVIPLAQLARGVPVELAAIVDKALAFETAERYRDAATLAEELRRFLAGQLVAAHAYTVRERFVRWVRQNLAAVVVGLLAIVVLTIVSFSLIGRILRERDIANAERQDANHQREIVQERVDIELIARARGTMITDPVAAVAALKQLPATSKHVEEARGVLLTARMHGAQMFAAPAAPSTALGASLSPSGERAFVYRGAGLYEVFDVPHPTKVVTRRFGADDYAVWVDHGKRLLVYGKQPPSFWDLTTDTLIPTTLPVLTDIKVSDDDRIAARDDAGRIGWIDLAAQSFTPLYTLERGDGAFAITRNGRYVIIADGVHSAPRPVFVFDGTHQIATGPVLGVDVAAGRTSKLAYFTSEGRAFEIDASAAAPTFVEMNAIPSNGVTNGFIPTFDDDRLLSVTMQGFVSVTPTGAYLTVPITGFMATSTPVGPAQFATVTSTEQVIVVDGSQSHQLTLPTALGHGVVAGRRGSPYLIVAGTAINLVVDLSDVEPRRLTGQFMMGFMDVDAATTLFVHDDGSYHLLDLDTGSIDPLRASDGKCCSMRQAPAAQGSAIVFYPLEGDVKPRAWVLRRNDRKLESVEGTDVTIVGEGDTIVIVDGREVSFERRGTRTHVATIAGKVVGIASDDNEVIIGTEHELTRIAFATMASERIAFSWPVNGSLTPYNHRLLVGRGRTFEWLDAPGVTVATTEVDNPTVYATRHGALLVAADEQGSFLALDETAPKAYPLGRVLAISTESVLVDKGDVLELVQLPSRIRLRMPAGARHMESNRQLVTSDGRRLLSLDAGGLRIWDLPRSGAFHDDVNATTNAIERDSVVVWPWQ